MGLDHIHRAGVRARETDPEPQPHYKFMTAKEGGANLAPCVHLSHGFPGQGSKLTGDRRGKRSLGK